MKLNKVDVTHRALTEPGVSWLLSNGYRLRFDGRKVFLVRECSS